MKPSRRYFKKAAAAKEEIARRPRKQSAAGKIKAGSQEFVYVPSPLGRGMVKVNARWAMMQLGRRNGALKIHELGKAHRWTSEEARKASKKVWGTRWRMNRRINKRIGRPAKVRSRLNRIAIREQHYAEPDSTTGLLPQGIYHDGSQWQMGHGLYAKSISERTALIKLGHLPNPHGYVPSIDRGTIDAQLRARRGQKDKS